MLLLNWTCTHFKIAVLICVIETRVKYVVNNIYKRESQD